jgi:hypothetical protein
MRAALLVFATLLSYAAAWLVGVPALVPAFNTLPAIPFLFLALKRGRAGAAIVEMLVWAASLGVAATLLSWVDPVGTGRLFVNGEDYRREMFAWVATGTGAESDPAQFVPTHIVHALAFSALSLVSGSLLSMPMGAVLMNYMGHYVGTLAAASGHPVTTALAAWVPWALVRIASYVTLGVVLAGPVMSRLGGFRFRLRDHFTPLVLALSGLLTDIVLKAALAPHWHALLGDLVGWSSGR